MKSAWPLLVLLLIGVSSIFLAVPTLRATNENQVAVVVDFGNGQIAAKCVGFAEETITGFEALQRSGLPVETDYQTGGAAVCRIDGQGCPSDDCFCECRGGDECKYWSYWHFTNGSWNYSVAGSSIYQVRDGAMDGWVWGLGSITQASPPPVLSFHDICTTGSEITPTATSTQPPTSTPLILPTFAPTEAGASPTRPMATATIFIQMESTPASPLLVEVTIPTPIPLATPLAVTATPQALMETTDNAAISLALATPQAEPNPMFSDSEERNNLPATSMEIDTILTQEGDVGMDEQATSAEVAEWGEAGEILANTLSANSAIPSGTPIVVSAVVGMDAVINQRSSDSMLMKPDETHLWVPYTGFAGLLLILCALGLLVYRRRTTDAEGGDQ